MGGVRRTLRALHVAGEEIGARDGVVRDADRGKWGDASGF